MKVSFTPFSIILIVIIAVLLLKKKRIRLDEVVYNFFVLKLVLDLVLDYGYFVKIGESTVSYSGIVSIILFAFSLLRMKQMDKKVLNNGVVFAIFLFVGIILGILLPYNHTIVRILNGWDRLLQGNYIKDKVAIGFYNLVFLFTTVRFIVILAAIRSILNDKNKVFGLVKKILSFSTLSIAYGYLEVILKNLFEYDVAANILSPMFGVTESTYSSLSLRGRFYMLQGLCKEPSYYSNTLFVFALMSIAYIYYVRHSSISVSKTIVKREIVRIVLLSILLILGLSFSSLFYLIFISIVFLTIVVGRGKALLIIRRLIILLPLALLLGVLALSLISGSSLEYYVTRFQQLSNTITQIKRSGAVGISNSSSEAVRITSIMQSVGYFTNRPLFGLGIGTTDCHSLIVSILSNCGILGLIFWGKTIMAFSRTEMKNKKFMIALSVLLCIFGSFGDTFTLYYPVLVLIYNCLYIGQVNGKGNFRIRREKKYEICAN